MVLIWDVFQQPHVFRGCALRWLDYRGAIAAFIANIGGVWLEVDHSNMTRESIFFPWWLFSCPCFLITIKHSSFPGSFPLFQDHHAIPALELFDHGWKLLKAWANKNLSSTKQKVLKTVSQ